MSIIIDGTNGISEFGNIDLQAQINNATQSIVNLASSSAQGQFGSSATNLTLSTSNQQVPFSVLTQSNNTNIFSINANNTLTIKVAGTYNFVSNVVFQNLGTGGINDNVTFTVVDSTTNAVYYTQPTVGVKTGANNNVTLSFNSLLTVGTVPVTVKIMVQSTGADYKILSLNSILSAQGVSGINAFSNITYKSTPVSVTAWSYSGTTTTTITLTVASHTFIVGDWINVSGLTTSTAVSTANNYIIPNGVYQVTAITGTSISYQITTPSALTLTPTVSSATVNGMTAINGVVPSARQTYNMTTQRALSTTYYNTSGKEKFISVYCIMSSSGAIYFYLDGNMIAVETQSAISGANLIQFPVQTGHNYQITCPSGTLQIWSETY